MAAQAVDVDSLTPTKVTAILRRSYDLPGAVTTVEAIPFSIGQAADSARLVLTYAGDQGDAPSTLVGKFASRDESSRALSISADLYARELGFYRELAPSLAVRTPALVHAEVAGDGRFALLLEDVAPATMVDQIEGCTPEYAEVAIRQAARLHASSWGREELAQIPWLASFASVLDLAVEHLPHLHRQFRATYGDMVDEPILALTDELVEVIPAWHRLTSDGYALWHHDYRPDNMLFNANGGVDPLVVVDWQTVSYGPAIADVSYFLGCGLAVEDRRAHERDLVAIYHDELVGAGVEAPDRDEVWSAYLDHAVTALFMAVHASVRVERTERGDQMWSSWLERSAAQITDHDVLARHRG
ncbi:phosphotransferase [Mycolicibacterium sp. lyk4-40-TYG-92]|uniref:phosphotransferase n=1 Tax=Mycolicibacterium sp. lyk4-40-TYG-92 TaxID=3040295 RepID=UPI00254E0BC4|nr:phosphotransferase [Mycolicibacterium sp. lyk4-40-TYG-92]